MTRKKSDPLSKKQQEVIDLMKQGWVLKSSATADTGSWLVAPSRKATLSQEYKNLHSNTVFSLFDRGLIKQKPGERFPSVEYVLTEQA